MNIYFAGSIRGGRGRRETYSQIIGILKKYGTVLTEHVADAAITASGEAGAPQDIYDRDIEWLTKSDVVIADVTTPSLGVGYEVATAERMKKPILALYGGGEGTLSAMISGSPDISVCYYGDVREMEKAVVDFMEKIKT